MLFFCLVLLLQKERQKISDREDIGFIIVSDVIILVASEVAGWVLSGAGKAMGKRGQPLL